MVSYTTVSPLPRRSRGALGRSPLCCAFQRVSPSGRYPAPLPCGVPTFLDAFAPRLPDRHVTSLLLLRREYERNSSLSLVIGAVKPESHEQRERPGSGATSSARRSPEPSRVVASTWAPATTRTRLALGGSPATVTVTKSPVRGCEGLDDDHRIAALPSKPGRDVAARSRPTPRAAARPGAQSQTQLLPDLVAHLPARR